MNKNILHNFEWLLAVWDSERGSLRWASEEDDSAKANAAVYMAFCILKILKKEFEGAGHSKLLIQCVFLSSASSNTSISLCFFTKPLNCLHWSQEKIYRTASVQCGYQKIWLHLDKCTSSFPSYSVFACWRTLPVLCHHLAFSVFYMTGIMPVVLAGLSGTPKLHDRGELKVLHTSI